MTRHGFYEFFAGGGMARAGLGAEWDCLFSNDFDPKKALVYGENWGSETLHVGDVAELSVEQLPGRADLVWASFPCQDLSLAGNGAGLGGARSGTFWAFWRLMEGLAAQGRKPKAVVLENVCGLLTSRGGTDFAALCQAVGDAGYWIGAVVMDAALFLPQSRPRLFVVALDQDAAVPGRLQSPYAVDLWHPARLRLAQAALAQPLRSRWLWFDPLAPPKSDTRLIDLVEEHPTGVRWHSAGETDRLLGMMSSVNRAKVVLVTQNGGRSVGAIYKRTRPESGGRVQRAEVRFDLAGCLRTPQGGSSRQTLLVIEDGAVRSRLISTRETARLMGLPDDYWLPDNYNDAYHVTGDGVAVPVVRYLVSQIIEPFLSAQTVERRNALAG